jgi:hypothetical protein
MTLFVFDRKVLATHQLRCNIKSLAAEAKIIRHETRRAGPLYRDPLAIHRRGRLREEARYAYLALGFLRGHKYREIERNAKELPSCDRVIEKLRRVLTTQPQDVSAWLNT